MEILLGGVAGLVSGVVGSFVAGIVHLAAKRLRNRRLVRRGEPPIRDALYDPLWLLFGILGFIAGVSWTWRLEGTWITGAIAGACVPGFAALVWIAWMLAQLRR